MYNGSCVNTAAQTCSTCSSCGTTCAGCTRQCPRCGNAMTQNT
jgi:hypothetical protein